MSFLDKARGKLTEAVDKHGDKIATGIDKAAAAADKRTGGKHGTTIAGGAAKAKEALQKLPRREGGPEGPAGPAGPGTTGGPRP